MRTVDLILPGLDLPAEYRAAAAFLPAWDCPAWNDICARAGARATKSPSLVSRLFQGSLKKLFLRDLDLPEDTPACFASPGTQTAQMHSLRFIAGETLRLSWTEAHLLAARVNDFLAGLAECHVCRPDLWLLTGDLPQEWTAPDPWSLHGRIDADDKITGRDARIMTKRASELQMFLFSLNLPRREAGLPVVNTLWLWNDLCGTGDSDAGAAGKVGFLPESCAARVLDEPTFEAWRDLPGERRLIYDTALESVVADRDLEEHVRLMREYDRDLFAPLRAEVFSGSLKVRIVTARKTLILKSWHRHLRRRRFVYRGFLP